MKAQNTEKEASFILAFICLFILVILELKPKALNILGKYTRVLGQKLTAMHEVVEDNINGGPVVTRVMGTDSGYNSSRDGL